MNNYINLNSLKYFYEVVNIGNITKASNILNISQPALTKTIKVLENDLGIKLFYRNKKGVIPTEEGLILYEHTKQIINNLNTTFNILDIAKNNQNYLYIGTTTTNFAVFIIDILKKFRQLYPNVHIKIILEDLNHLNNLARLGKLDILIKNNYEQFNNFNKIKSFTINDKFIASKTAFPELSEKVYSIKELLEYPFVLLSNISHSRRVFNDYLQTQNINFKPTYEFNSYSLCRELIKEGFGIGIGNPIHYIADDFIIIKTKEKLPTRYFDIGYITTSNNELLKNFCDLFKN